MGEAALLGLAGPADPILVPDLAVPDALGASTLCAAGDLTLYHHHRTPLKRTLHDSRQAST